MDHVFLIAVYWGATALLVLAYVGYPLLLTVIAKKRTLPPSVSAQPTVSIVLVARNEAWRIKQRLLNLLDSSLPIQELVVVCDGCTDETAKLAREIGDPAIRVIELESARGKPAGINAGMQVATGEVVVLCDARQRFDRQTVPRLVRWFADPETGAVSGALEIESASSTSGRGVDAYWRLEKMIRQWESDMDSCVGCTGAVYAVRRSCFRPLAEDIILDDVVLPMQVAASGLRVRFDRNAIAYDPQSLDGAVEHRRKVRTLAGNFQMMARYVKWMMPWGHRLWWNLILHKYLRLAGPVLLLIVFLTSLLLIHQPFFLAATALQVGMGLMAFAGLMIPGLKERLFALPAGFLFLQWCVVKGFVQWLVGNQQRGWR
jgi:cellulose synthase/poly-beta-1,6-N-acetylglucosamine synthase-like glycosyltransferase